MNKYKNVNSQQHTQYLVWLFCDCNMKMNVNFSNLLPISLLNFIFIAAGGPEETLTQSTSVVSIINDGIQSAISLSLSVAWTLGPLAPTICRCYVWLKFQAVSMVTGDPGAHGAHVTKKQAGNTGSDHALIPQPIKDSPPVQGQLLHLQFVWNFNNFFLSPDFNVWILYRPCQW